MPTEYGPAPLAFNINELNQLMFDTIATSSGEDATALRDYLTAQGADPEKSIVWADKLDLTLVSSMPSRPILALRAGPIGTEQRIVATPLYWWWIYDNAEQEYWRIDHLIWLISRAYAAKPFPQLSQSVLNNVVVSAPSRQSRDDVTQLRWRYVSVTMQVA